LAKLNISILGKVQEYIHLVLHIYLIAYVLAEIRILKL